MEKNCLKCGKTFKVTRAKEIKTKHYCSQSCRSKLITKPCGTCGTPVTRVQSQMLETAYCNRKCAKAFTGPRMRKMNEELNPERMTIGTRLALRAAKLGRPLVKGECVHHIDRNRKNNDPSNLMVFASHSEHMAQHKKENRERKEHEKRLNEL